MIKIVTNEFGSKVLVKSWRPKLRISGIEEEFAKTCVIFLKDSADRDLFLEKFGKEFSVYGFLMPIDEGNQDRPIPILYRACSVHFRSESRREKFLRKLEKQREFLYFNLEKRVVKRYKYDKNSF